MGTRLPRARVPNGAFLARSFLAFPSDDGLSGAPETGVLFGPSFQATGLTAIGPTHVAFTVSDLDQLFARLTEQSVRFNAPPQLAPDGKAKVTFCFDPDGTPIELVEELGPLAKARV